MSYPDISKIDDQPASVVENIAAYIQYTLDNYQQPSAHELVEQIECEFGLVARWDLPLVVSTLAESSGLTRANRQYLCSLIGDGSLAKALRGEDAPDRELLSTIDALFQQSKLYRSSEEFQEMIEFMGLFRDYAPYNNMLIRIQNPSCSFYATARDWQNKFGRNVIEDARPMLILAPMHPVMLVYDLDQTEGTQLPEDLVAFATFEGQWEPSWLTRTMENAERHFIRVDFKTLSSTQAGFATIVRDTGDWKMRIVVHDGLDGPSRLGVLFHELAHIFLGHLGTDQDYWWPGRMNLNRASVEVEAESVAFIATNRLGLSSSSKAYVSTYLNGGKVPTAVSPDLIAKVASRIERMTHERMSPKRRDEKKASR